jgi:hypothetical protein
MMKEEQKAVWERVVFRQTKSLWREARTQVQFFAHE